MFRRFSIYGPLLVLTLITLVPFVYLVCSAFKTRKAFFSSPFLPTSGLFEIEATTGALGLVDTTHMDGLQTKDFTLRVAMCDVREDRVIDDAEVIATVTRDDNPDTEEVEYSLKMTDIKGQPIKGPPDVLASSQEGVRYEIAEGNPHGFLGIAWGQLTVHHFKRLMSEQNFLRNVVNSLFIASVSSVLATLFAAMGGYALAKFRFFGRESITSAVLILLIVPGSLLFAPTYQLLYWFGMLDSFPGLIVPGLAPAFGVYLFRQAMISSLPDEMLEAGRIDGCGEFKLFFSFALPMVRPMVGTFILITFLGAWNNYIGAQIIIKSPEMLPLSVAVAQLRSEYGQDYGMLMAGTLVSIAPVMLLFLMLQREFIEGLSSGAVKG